MKKKGFTLVELLVVIAIIALLMGILMPALAAVRRIAQRMVCGTNLAGIGKAMMIYANENDEDYPRAGGRGAKWDDDGVIEKWDVDPDSQTPETDAFGEPPNDNIATITSSFFLLIKYADVTPKQFVCKGDAGTTVFTLGDTTTIEDITDAWDFGEEPGDHVSYSYHMPYNFDGPSRPIIVSSNPASPIAADRNPYLDLNAHYVRDLPDGENWPYWDDINKAYRDPDKTGNAAAHQREGQNVLFNDIHVNFEKYPNCGVNNDNIWKCWESSDPGTDQERQLGPPDYFQTLNEIGKSQFGPKNQEDAFLVNEVIEQTVSSW